MALAPGDEFGRYRIVSPLGRGGMASVFEAHEAELDRRVALKVLPPEFLHDPSFAERFRREARVVAMLEHAHIVPIYAFGIDEGIPWMAMRLVDGGALSARLREGRLAPAAAVRIISGVAAALEYAHERDVLHRDVKPQNVLLDREGHPYLADFGVARIVEGTTTLTKTGAITGTPQYMAPEQARGGTLDRRCDIYALGIVAYELFVGVVPFSADTPVAVLMKHVSEPVPPPPAGAVPEALMVPVLKALAKTPSERWTSAREFSTALQSGLTGAGPYPAHVPDGDATSDAHLAGPQQPAATASLSGAPSEPWPPSGREEGGLRWLLEHPEGVFIAGLLTLLLAAVASTRRPDLAMAVGGLAGFVVYLGVLLWARRLWHRNRAGAVALGVLVGSLSLLLAVQGGWKEGMFLALLLLALPALITWALGRWLGPSRTASPSPQAEAVASGGSRGSAADLLAWWRQHPWPTFWLGLLLVGVFAEGGPSSPGAWAALGLAYVSYVQGVRVAWAASRWLGALIVATVTLLIAVPSYADGEWISGTLALLVAFGVPAGFEALVRRLRPADAPQTGTTLAPGTRKRLVTGVAVAFTAVALFIWVVGEPQRNLGSAIRQIRPGMSLSEVLATANGRVLVMGPVGESEEGKPAPPSLYAASQRGGRFSFSYDGRRYGNALSLDQLAEVLAANPEVRPTTIQLVFLSSWGLPNRTFLGVRFDAEGRVEGVIGVAAQN